MRRIGGAYFSGRLGRDKRFHVYADCGFIKDTLVEAPLYSDDGGESIYLYARPNGMKAHHRAKSTFHYTAWPTSKCRSCEKREERADERKERAA